MLEKSIAVAAEKLLEAEFRRDAANAALRDALEEEHKAEARGKKLSCEAQVAEENFKATEEFDGTYEAEERRRDLAVSHAANHLYDDVKHILYTAISKEKEAKSEKEKMETRMRRLEQNEAELKADLKEIQKIIANRLAEEWRAEKSDASVK